MNTYNQKINITVFYRNECPVSNRVVRQIKELNQQIHYLNLALVNLDEAVNPQGIYISPTIMISGKVWSIGCYDHNKLVRHLQNRLKYPI